MIRRLGADTRDEVLAVLDTVMDPEVPVLSVRELGIVRDVLVDDRDGVTVVVTPTYSGCPAIQVIERDILTALERAGFGNAKVRTTYSPAWTTDWIPDSAKAKLKAYGIAPPGAAADTGGLVQLMRARQAPPCPYCDSTDTELRSEFGSTACKSVCWCRSCRQPFEEFKAI
ncbi:MAG TPA: 1,2-phenylacetyl-CoA epoxidase subunit PaaD [Gemmatimonadaceae bacterium]|nr:1,2-phenylacetyl-CoA epoxidase subunit PaaD [Gemmatimonadaceae bacterium]